MTTQFTRRDMLKRAAGITLGGAALATGVSLNNAVAAPKAQGSGLDAAGILPDGGTFDGVLSGMTATLDRATNTIMVAGTLDGLVTAVGGAVTEIVGQLFNVPALLTPSGDVCDILFLDLGPIYLDLLGLTVDLSEIVLDINAVPGAGNLLGNLLCAITGLLDNAGGGGLNGIANLLNRILAILG